PSRYSFQRSAYHAAIHSLPTRRSSDLFGWLRRGAAANAGIANMALEFATACAPASIGNVGVGFDVLGLAFGAAHDRVTAVREARDRKSTRLNSSHSQISYAVFCLKKKK